jgi:NNP family nitrate/nitrite transporter-like MFS transporter
LLSLLLLLLLVAVLHCTVTAAGMGFIIARLFIGFSLAAFVCCQFWCTSMFNTKVVGSANAIAAGWGNMGGGITHFLMPIVWQGIAKSTPSFIAWRWAFFLPASCHVIMGIAVMVLSQVRQQLFEFKSRMCSGGRQSAVVGLSR